MGQIKQRIKTELQSGPVEEEGFVWIVGRTALGWSHLCDALPNPYPLGDAVLLPGTKPGILRNHPSYVLVLCMRNTGPKALERTVQSLCSSHPTSGRSRCALGFPLARCG